ncbi:MBG domain-containing protein [Halomonas urumqiensis]|uniref:MBG domain-containing protein n=3 Tax=Halomonas urumqiensis TaxID=1684789 RepID=UPI0015E7C890|nr:MBG domain-containing protein [Halomonas urumqiensis]GHE21205.1 hypothetical protein GCM10017767_17260 [Halomonas urumqiensis]
MNRIYRTVWNTARGQWQVAPETVNRQGKTSRRTATVGTVAALAAGSLLVFPLSAFASGLPSGGDIRAGSGSIEQSGNTMRINQDTDRMAMDWDDFSVEDGHRVEFNQPGRDAAALNRVTGDQLSQIRGAIDANGQVFLVNPNGIVFGDTAQVDVGGLVASTLDISPEDFMAGDFTFEGSSSSAIINQGNIRAGEEGYVALIAAEIINEGSIRAPRGDVMMGAGSRVTLDMGGPIKIEVEQALLDTYIEQGGAIRADGGRVYLTAKAAGDLAASVINHTGVTQARTVAENEQGEIWLMGDEAHGETQVAGTLDASAPEGGDGGFVEASAAKVSIMDEATVTTRADDGETGEWLIDSQDYTVAPSGGGMTGNSLSNNLTDNNVTIESVEGGEDGNGDIFVNDEVTWSSGNTLTLNAQRDIEINQEMDASQGDGGKLALEYGQGSTNGEIGGEEALFTANAPVNLQAGQNFSTQIGSGGAVREFTVITELGKETGYADGTLQAIRDGLDGYYALGADIDANETSTWNGGDGWEPLRTFRGIFDGLGHDISSLTINRSSEDNVGFFGYMGADSYTQNINLTDVDITGSFIVGGLVGRIYNGIIHNSEVTGRVTGESDVTGGVVGSIEISVLKNSSASVHVSGKNFVGGLGGAVQNRAKVYKSYATGRVEGVDYVGGLIGVVANEWDESSDVKNSYATGAVSGTSKIGGLVGHLGTVGSMLPGNATVNNNYATGQVTGDSAVGGLLGSIDVADGTEVKIENNFWDVDTSGIGSAGDVSNGATGLTSAEMKQASIFIDAGWDDSIWSIGGTNTSGYGVFRPYLTNVTREEDIPDKITLFDDGFGTEDQPFTLTDWQQLQNINHNDDVLTSGYYYALANNLDTSTEGYTEFASATANNGKGWEPIGNDTHRFSGTFDGQGNTLTELIIDRPSQDVVGQFGYTDGATIRNVGLEDGSVTGNSSVGGLVGYNNSSTISNSYANGDVMGLNDVGGLIGTNFNLSSTVSNSYSTGNVEGNDNIGGLVGINFFSTISSSYATGSVKGDSNVGGLLGANRASATVSNSYADGSVKGDSNVGGLVGFNRISSTVSNSYAAGSVEGSSNNVGGLVGLNDSSTVSASYWDTETTGQNSSAGGTGLSSSEMRDSSTFTDAGWDAAIWSFGAGSEFAGYGLSRPYLTNVTRDEDIPDQPPLFDDGFGTEDQPFTLTDWQQLQNINHNDDVLTGGYYYALANNLDTSTDGYNELASASANEGKGWEPIGENGREFTGVFDGSNHTVSNLVVSRESKSYIGLFGRSSNSSFKNVGVVDVDIDGLASVGGLIGYIAFSDITNAYSTGEIKGDGDVGGLVGIHFNGLVENSYSTVSIKGSSNSGGLVGYNIGDLRNTNAQGDVEGTRYVGGLVGNNDVAGSIRDSYSSGAVKGDNLFGGLVGYDGSIIYSLTPDISNSFWDVDTSGIGEAGDSNYGATGLTSAQMQYPSTFTDAGWDKTIWSLGAGADAAGYGLSRPYLTNVTREEDIPDQTPLFDDGFGTEDQPFTLTDWQQLQNINYNDDVLTGGYYYALANDLDTSTQGYTELASATANDGKGWEPIGGAFINEARFTGNFDGNNRTVSDVAMERGRWGLGLFGGMRDASVSDLSLHNPSIETNGNSYYVGALSGLIDKTTVDNVTISGDQAEVSGYTSVGGLVGQSNMSSISNSHVTIQVTGNPDSEAHGGLVGFNLGSLIEDSAAEGNVSGGRYTGGAVGNHIDGMIRNTQSSGDVSSSGVRGYVGGFVGFNQGPVERASAVGNVSGPVGDDFNASNTLGMGSFAGDNKGTLRDIQASGSVTASNATGNEIEIADGLLGRNTGSLFNGLASNDNTAYWLQHDNDMAIASQPNDSSQADSAAIKSRLEAGINVNLATTGDTQSFDAGIGTIGTVDLGDASHHNAALSISALNEITLSSAQALRLGAVNAGDAIDIATQAGDMTLTGDITTADASNQALRLSAGEGENAGSPSGGDIDYQQGDLTTGSGGHVLLYTGSLAGSEAIAALIDTGDFRYNSTPAETNFTAALDADRHLVYREQPEILVSADGKTITYGDSVPADYDLKSTRGYVNSDDDSILSGTPQWSVDETLSNAGYQEAGEHRIDYADGFSNPLGYAIVTDVEQTGALTVDPLALTATEITETKAMYGDALEPGDVVLEGVLNDDQTTADAEVVDVSLSTSNNINTGTYDQGVDTKSLAGEDAANYTVTAFTQPDSATVTQRPLTVTANSATTTYDGTEQNVTGFTAEGLVASETEAVLDNVTTTGGSGTDAGSYQHEASGTDTNYALTFNPGELTIDKANATVTASSATTTYDGTEQNVTGFTAEGLVASETEAVLDNVTTTGGSGTDAGSYQHEASGTDTNYALTFNPGELTIDKANATVTANSATTTYDGTEQSVTGFTVEGLVNGEDESVLTNVRTTGGSGTDAGSYIHAIDGTAKNYLLTFNDGQLTIDPRPITVIADDQQKTYGNDDPELTWQVTDGNLVGDDSLSGDVTREAGNNVGDYAISPADLANGNYVVSAENGTLSIDPRPITVTADDQQKTYGDADQTLTWQVTDGNLVGDDTLMGDVAREAGSDVGDYAISAADLANGNYVVSAENGTLSIDPRPITVTADDQQKIYGDADPALTWQVTDGNLIGDDSLAGDVTREAGSDVGDYAISAADLANGNYVVSAENGTLSIDPRPITVTADDQQKTYGNDDPALNWQVTDGNLVGDDSLSGDVTREAGNNVGNYAISAADLANGNYVVSAENGTLSIDPRPITVAADDQQKIYGDADPALTWQVTDGNLVGDDSLTGNLTRETGDNVGNYAIQQGSFDEGQDPNYAINFLNGELVIIPGINMSAVINQTLRDASSNEQETPLSFASTSTRSTGTLPGGIAIMDGGINTDLDDDAEGDN